MEIAFYYSFKEFKKNYNIDFKNWSNTYPDANEIDYLNELRNKYQLFFYENNSDFIINSNWISSEYPEYYELSIISYHEFMQGKLIDYLYSNGFSNFDGDFLEIPFDTNVMDFWDDCNIRTRKNNAIIDDEKHKYLKDLFVFNNYTHQLDFDSKKFTNSKFATKKILEFLDKKSQLIISKIKFEKELVEDKDIFSTSQKIKIKGSLQSIGYLFSELIEKGFIEAPKRNGKDNTSAISRMILDHFEFIDKEEQPKPEDIRKTLFTENKLSADKQNQFKIPQSKIINTD
ncbi:hypothetical protein DRF59_12555 [Chryseobacterium flavum]|uniref:Uncharacterized protein n=1 Tax=Chryseobacterium flavum TaxID=415851 RepID=A0A3D9CKK8_9FLAO|nr:hypothetical protein [Chryseobacterium flavum]REC66296.1 hypothetical protein DRF59_12555 [Chryseobacterium flavum]